MDQECALPSFGTCAHSYRAGKALNVVPWEYTPKKWTEEDVDSTLALRGRPR